MIGGNCACVLNLDESFVKHRVRLLNVLMLVVVLTRLDDCDTLFLLAYEPTHRIRTDCLHLH